MYGGFTLIAAIVLAKWMPETKGLGLERIAEVFGIVSDEREMITLATGRETPGEGAERRRRAAMERRGSAA